MQDPKCVKCDAVIKVYSKQPNIKCAECGAYYVSSRQRYDITETDKDVEFVFEFKEFRCVHASYMNSCDNICPTLGMYCKDHTSDKFIDEVQREIVSNDKRLQDSKVKLDKVYESKRNWLITGISGI